jgi:LmbE family N-acetylglucosaminyl deacetylase
MNVVVVSPHPDDAEYGAGGLLAAIGASGAHDAHVVCFTPWPELGLAGGAAPGDRADRRLVEATEAARLLGVQCVTLPPRSVLDGTSAVQDIIDVFQRLRPDVVLTVDPDDSHPFHHRVSQWVQDAVFLSQLPSDGQSLPEPPQLLLMEAYTTRRFDPDVVVDVTAWFPLARRALLAHRTGVRITPGLEYQMRVIHQMHGCRAAVPFAEGFRLQHHFGQDWAPRRAALFGLLADVQNRTVVEVAG